MPLERHELLDAVWYVAPFKKSHNLMVTELLCDERPQGVLPWNAENAMFSRAHRGHWSQEYRMVLGSSYGGF